MSFLTPYVYCNVRLSEMEVILLIEVKDKFPFSGVRTDFKDLGICVASLGCLSKDGTAGLADKFAISLNSRLHFNRKLGEYVTKWGNRSYYLGMYQKKSPDVVFKLFSFPVSLGKAMDVDLTKILCSCEELVRNCDKYRVHTCFLPSPVADNFCGLPYESVVKPVLELALDDRFYVDVGKFDCEF